MKSENRFYHLAAFVLVISLLLFHAAHTILVGRQAGQGERRSHKVDVPPSSPGAIADPNSKGEVAADPAAANPRPETEAEEGIESDSGDNPSETEDESDESSDSGEERAIHGPAAAEPDPTANGKEPAAKAGAYSKFPGPRITPVAATSLVPRAQIAQRIQGFLAQKGLSNAKIGISIVSADGTVLYEKDAATPLVLASNNKLFTTATALLVLGPDFEFTTRAFAKGKVSGGVVDGDLVVVGDGDPDMLQNEPTEASSLGGRLAAALKAAGIQRVNGDLVVDDSIFDRQYIPPQWLKTQLPHDYAAPVSGFSLFENCLVVRVKPAGKVGAKASASVLPDCAALAATSELLTAAAKSKNNIVIPSPVQVGKVKVSGETPFGANPAPLFVPIANPGEAHPSALLAALTRAGIVVAGKAKLASAAVPRAGLAEIASVKTPLRAVLHKVDKESSNVLAEHVYKRVGATKGGRGTFENASHAVLETLGKLGIDTNGAVSVDGSGLSRGNAYSPRQVAMLLRALWTHGNGDLRPILVDSLPIAGVDGTLSKRLTQGAYKARVRAKTGYIAGVSALSGYAATDDGEVICFSVIVNGVKGATAAKKLEDSIAKLLVDLAKKG